MCSLGHITYPGKCWGFRKNPKTYAKLVLKEKYKNYENALILLDLNSLEERRKEMCLKFAKNGIKNKTLNDLFPMNEKMHPMKTRENNKFKVNFANTDRLKNSSIISMQNMLNEDSSYNWDETSQHETSVFANYDYQSPIDCIIHIAVINLILSYLIFQRLCQ